MSERWDVVIDLLRRYDCETYCEIGVRSGNNLTRVIKATGVSAIAIDPWENIPNDGESYDHWDFEAIKAEYDEAVVGLDVRTIRKTSIDAVDDVGFVDLVWIDAAHDYKNCYADITAWLPKCRVISGHDYDPKFPGVMRAVDELLPNRSIGNNAVWWYVK